MDIVGTGYNSIKIKINLCIELIQEKLIEFQV